MRKRQVGGALLFYILRDGVLIQTPLNDIIEHIQTGLDYSNIFVASVDAENDRGPSNATGAVPLDTMLGSFSSFNFGEKITIDKIRRAIKARNNVRARSGAEFRSNYATRRALEEEERVSEKEAEERARAEVLNYVTRERIKRHLAMNNNTYKSTKNYFTNPNNGRNINWIKIGEEREFYNRMNTIRAQHKSGAGAASAAAGLPAGGAGHGGLAADVPVGFYWQTRDMPLTLEQLYGMVDMITTPDMLTSFVNNVIHFDGTTRRTLDQVLKIASDHMGGKNITTPQEIKNIITSSPRSA
jgi:hypothetical protein